MAKLHRYKDFIKEDRAQLTLPFKEKRYKGKSVHGHLEDAFIDLRIIDADKYSSKASPDSKIDEARDSVFQMLIDEQSNWTEYVGNFINAYDPREDEYKSMYDDEILGKLLDDIDDDNFYYEFCDRLTNEISKLDELFSKDGWNEFERISNDKIDEDSYNMIDTVKDSYKSNDGGLIDCWRTVGYSKGDAKDVYLNIMKHGGVGVYWAWDESKAEAYWKESGGHEITLHGKVSVENVDWETSIYASCYYLNEEREIRVNAGGFVMIVGYRDDEIDKYIEFDEPFVVKAGKA